METEVEKEEERKRRMAGERERVSEGRKEEGGWRERVSLLLDTR